MASGLSPAPKRSWDLARLVAPFPSETFLAEHWESRPLHVPRTDPGYYRDVVSLQDIDQLIATASIAARQVTVVGGPDESDGEGATDADTRPTGRPLTSPGGPELLYERFRGGATIVLSFLQERFSPLREFCTALGRELSTGVQANAYVTPAHAQGLAAHYDTHDVFVGQIAGSKRWRLYDAPVETPLAAQHYRRDEHRPTGAATVVDPHAGDLLYLPRGVVHEAQSLDSVSVHLAIGILGITWAEVLHAAVDLFARSAATARHTLPVGFARSPGPRRQAEAAVPELVAAFGAHCRATDLVEHAAALATSRLGPVVEGYLCGIAGSPGLTTATELRRRGEDWTIERRDEERLMLSSGTRFLSMPARLEPELSWLREAAMPVTADDLPGSLLPPERLVLMRRLLQDGFLRIA